VVRQTNFGLRRHVPLELICARQKERERERDRERERERERERQTDRQTEHVMEEELLRLSILHTPVLHERCLFPLLIGLLPCWVFSRKHSM
jgi:hypothetical protein